MAGVKRFEDLEAWRSARLLANTIYRVTATGAFSRDFGLKDQVRRASISVMSNIAEGFESRTNNLFVDYLGRAKGSCGEVRSQLYVASDLEYISSEEMESLMDLAQATSRQIYGIMRYLQAQDTTDRVREDSMTYRATDDYSDA